MSLQTSAEAVHEQLLAALAALRKAEGVVRLLLAEKHYEPAGGLVLDAAMPLAIAGQAALLQMRAGADYFPDLETVLIYPKAFQVDHSEEDEHGFVHEWDDELAGQSWQRGVVVVSWQDLAQESQQRDGYNVVLHEFAHQLDEQSGEADGTPLLPTAEFAERWHEAFQAAFERHRRSLRRRRKRLFDENAAESPAEFFATAMELFFELPRHFRKEFADLHALLAEYLELDPAAWPRLS